MTRLTRSERKGLNKPQLLIWGLVFALIGILSRSILQNGILHANTLTGEELLAVISSSNIMMAVATAAIVMQVIEVCAIPIFAFLLVDGFEKAKDIKKLALCLLAVALISEIPYNLAMYGTLLHTATRNPAMTLVIGLAAMYFFDRFRENSFANVLIKLFVGLCAVLWVVLLNVEHGLPLLLVILAMWALRNKKSMRILFGGAAAALCAMFSPMYMASALGILPVYFYREEEESPAQISLALYAVYPAILLVAGIICVLL